MSNNIPKPYVGMEFENPSMGVCRIYSVIGDTVIYYRIAFEPVKWEVDNWAKFWTDNNCTLFETKGGYYGC